ncbi:MarR family transcriptional regulator [Embleya sp. NBC_00888]|uniref:MarR family winged helix-turn-helix transcriptional regulator n=1 Tax=Embleya sp. NBC_00888 TaxID=2975960 RepID=UPI0038650B52|nr:MarR family transcriptional regulator [Embleya sp. NBC_00888]
MSDSVERRVVREVGAATRLIRLLMAPPLQAAGITQAEYHLLAHLEERGTSTGKELACRLSLDKTTISRQLTALEEARLIARTTDPTNRRSHLITLTDAGRLRLADARQRSLAVMAERFTSWPKEELGALADHLARFNDVLRGDSTEAAEQQQQQQAQQ